MARENREVRNFASFEMRAADAGIEGGIVEGYASTFDKYELWSYEGREYTEIWTEEIDPHAFDAADMTDVIFLRDHAGQVYARTKNNLITLTIDEHGLFTRTDLTRTTGAREMYEDITAGNYTQMSFAFTVAADEITIRDEIKDTGVIYYERKISAIEKVYDISAVARPANPNTDISAATRAAFDGAIEQYRTERSKLEARAREQARQALLLKMKIGG